MRDEKIVMAEEFRNICTLIATTVEAKVAKHVGLRFAKESACKHCHQLAILDHKFHCPTADWLLKCSHCMFGQSNVACPSGNYDQ